MSCTLPLSSRNARVASSVMSMSSHFETDQSKTITSGPVCRTNGSLKTKGWPGGG